jgi:hypothetical protein
MVLSKPSLISLRDVCSIHHSFISFGQKERERESLKKHFLSNAKAGEETAGPSTLAPRQSVMPAYATMDNTDNHADARMLCKEREIQGRRMRRREGKKCKSEKNNAPTVCC